MEEIKRPCSFEAASNMEIKVAIRVKVLVSPLLSWVYCSLENLFLSLLGPFNRVFSVSSSSSAPLPSFWPLLRFGRDRHGRGRPAPRQPPSLPRLLPP